MLIVVAIDQLESPLTGKVSGSLKDSVSCKLTGVMTGKLRCYSDGNKCDNKGDDL